MRMGIIGLGMAGRVHLDAARATRGVEVAAVCDPSLPAKDVAAREGLATYDDLDDLLDSERLDAVAICTPPDVHAQSAIGCMARGLHVLCEKPLALDPIDAFCMFEVAQRHGVLLAVASKFRHLPEIARARELITSGALGELLAFDLSFCAPSDMSRRWNALPSIAGGGVISDNGPHLFDLAIYLFGGIERVHATLLRPLQALSVEDSAHLRLLTEGSVMGTSSLSWSVAAAEDRYLLVHGSHGSLSVGWRGAFANIHGAEQRRISLGGPYDKMGAHRRMYERFRDAIHGDDLWIRPDECMQITAAVRAAYRSMASDGWEAIREAGEPQTALDEPRRNVA